MTRPSRRSGPTFATNDSGEPRYTGSAFDTFAGGGDAAPDELTAADLVAVSTLAVHVPARAALSLLDEQAEEVSALLSDIDPSWRLEDLDDDQFAEFADPRGAAQRLWNLLRRTDSQRWGIGPTTASKIMARKRPHLVPVYDSVVKGVVGLRGSAEQWERWWTALRANDHDLAHRLRALRTDSGQEHLSLLRVLDITLWMHGRGPAVTAETVGDAEEEPGVTSPG